MHFDTAPFPYHVTFDDGRAARLNLPWFNFVEARWDYREPDVVKMEIGAWVIVLRGHQLAPLFAAVEDHSLLRVRAQPELVSDPEREADTFVTQVIFMAAPTRGQLGKGGEQIELDLGNGPQV